MKYKEGNIVLLDSGETMYIYQIDEKSKTYYVSNCDNDKDLREVKDSQIFQLVT